MEKFKAFLRRKDIEISIKRYGIDALAEELAGMDIFGGVIGYVTELQDKAVVFE